MITDKEKILIIDEAGFSRVCSAILEADGFQAETISSKEQPHAVMVGHDVGLVITSYPFGSSFFAEVRRKSLPIIVLTDHISKDLLTSLSEFEKSICMMKPLNYDRFKSLVRQLMNGDSICQGGYSIV